MPIAALSGSLLSNDALERVIVDALGAALDPAGARAAHPRVAGWHRRARILMGPACSARAVFDRIASPLLEDLGYTLAVAPASSGSVLHALLSAQARTVASLVVTTWGRDPASAWREAVRHGIAHGVRWCLCTTGVVLRAIDTERTYSRRFAQFDLDLAIDDPAAFAALWGLLRADAFDRHPPLLDRAAALSEQHRSSVRMSLQEGVHEALLHLLNAFARSARKPARLS